MYTSPNMGLTIWNLLSDLFSHVQLENDFLAIDSHDHTNGHGVQIPTGGIQDGAITIEKLASSVLALLVPTGALVSYGGTAAPTGYLLCDGSVVSQTTYAALFGILSTTYDIGGEGAGNFRLPDLRQRFPLGKAASGTGSTLGGSGGTIDHSHSIPSLTVNALGIPSLTVNGHTHSLSGAGGADLSFEPTSGDVFTYFAAHDGPAVSINEYSGNFEPYLNTASPGTGYLQQEFNAFAGPGAGGRNHIGLLGSTDSDGATTAGNSTSPGTTVANTTGTQNAPYQVVNYIIKT